MSKPRTRKDKWGRTWEYSDGEGAWETRGAHGMHVIGCGANNKSKWQVWSSDERDEYQTLKEAMETVLPGE